jgi:DNA adenine methylase
VIGDSLPPLAAIWRAIVDGPGALAEGYERLWREGAGSPRVYARVRARYNAGGGEAELLYLLARCAKSAPRWNGRGEFNQAPDLRRKGAQPERVRRALDGAHALLAGRCEVRASDFRATVADAGRRDLVYLDPPWQGVSSGGDTRYHRGLARGELLDALAELDRRGVPFALSYDGRSGARRYGEPLPSSLARRIELDAGRSAQATLAGRVARTVESLYLSRRL